ncbi:MAG: tRNA (guanosine(46)-N7)-methyltransferase TrmB [Alphaproteobacteria bacterium]|nr:tRNA (guanosine(46)-N7)-methyltransferase TrmB [Alphaproteobacteria bacterium]
MNTPGSEPERRHQVFGRRRGRPLRPGQKTLANELLPQLAINLPPSGRLDLAALFGRARPSIWLEIGFGGGEHLAQLAERHPQIGFIGCEVFENGIVKLLGEIERRRLDNIRIFSDDARSILAAMPPASVDRVFILFPDPWPKRRQHKRRIVSRATLDVLAEIMSDDAELRMATDDGDYLSWILENVTAHRRFEWRARRPADWRERPPDWPPTRYEAKARAAGRPPAFLRVRRRPRATIRN